MVGEGLKEAWLLLDCIGLAVCLQVIYIMADLGLEEVNTVPCCSWALWTQPGILKRGKAGVQGLSPVPIRKEM